MDLKKTKKTKLMGYKTNYSKMLEGNLTYSTSKNLHFAQKQYAISFY